MPKEKLPKLTESQINSLASGQSFERGKSYYRNGAITEPVRQGMELRGECEGSEDEPYEVIATLNKDGVAAYSCTCPYDHGGICKHLVALLLTYIHAPNSFTTLDKLQSGLNQYSKEELIQLIGDLVKREPKLKSVVQLSQAAPRAGKPMNVAAYRAQAKRAMASESLRTVLGELKALRDTARRMAKAGDYINAGAISHVALDEAIEGYDYLMQEIDYNGDICTVMDDLAEDLSECLKAGQANAATRWAWLETMLGTVFKDIELGGIDIAPSAGEAVLEQANEEEWAKIEALLRPKIKGASDWERASLVGFLTEGLGKREQTKQADELIRDLGTPEQQTYLLIDEGNFGEALRRIKQIIPGKPGLVTQFADSLLQAGAQQEALKLVQQHGSEHHWNQSWLVKYYEQYGTPEEIVDARFQSYLSSPTIDAFKALSAASQSLGNWNPIRAKILQELEAKKHTHALMEIALFEKDTNRALELLPNLRQGWYGINYDEQVARLCEKDQPKKALELYQKMIEAQIGMRSRGNYQQAVEYLKRVQQVYESLQAKADWQKYVQSLRAKYPTLRALKEEMDKVGI